MRSISRSISKSIAAVRSKAYIIAVCTLSALLVMESVFLILHAVAQPQQSQPVSASPTSSNDWGLSFSTKGATPQANVSAEYLKQFDAYFVGDTSTKEIYLTFDAGYENGNTEQILDILKAQDVPAAFFLVEHYFQTSPDIVKRMVAEGHIVGNHTTTHPDMSKITDTAAFEKELGGVEAAYQALFSQNLPRYYRPPQGKFSESNLKQAQALGYKTIFWSLAYVDWKEDNQPSEDYALEKLFSRTHPGAIVLLHSTSGTNAKILNRYITGLKEQGYSFKSLDELP